MGVGIYSLLSEKKEYLISEGLKIISNQLNKLFVVRVLSSLKKYTNNKIEINILAPERPDITKGLFYNVKLDIPSNNITLSIDRKTVDIIITLFFGGTTSLMKAVNMPVTKLERIAVTKMLDVLVEAFLPIFDKRIVSGHEEVACYEIAHERSSFYVFC